MSVCACRLVSAGLIALSALGTEAGAQVQAGEAKAGGGVVSAPRAAAVGKPSWTDLNLSQQLALQPLAGQWSTLSAAHKSKWLAMSRNFPKMTTQEQSTLHSRMTGWSSLSQQERAQARLNFADVKQVPADERKAKWEAYQALTVDQKRALADRADTRPRGAALPVRPPAAQKFAPVPTPAGDHLPRIQLPPATEPVAAPARSSVPTRQTARPSSGAPVSAEAQVPAPVSEQPTPPPPP